MTSSSLIVLLTAVSGILVFILLVLALVYWKMKNDEAKPAKEDSELTKTKNTSETTPKTKEYTICSVFDFMDFDKIEDNMIIQKKGKRFLMAIECKGINYDLMSKEEKASVEEGFIQFLNTLSYPVQLYIQTRKVNLESSIIGYKEKINEIEAAYRKQSAQYTQLSQNPNISKDILRKEYFELVRQKNLYEYGRDIVRNTEKMSLNKNILNKNYYVIISYMNEEEDKLGKDELKENAFSELYTRAQSIIGSLSVSGVIGKIMDSNELAQLLYVAFNREDSDVMGVDKAIKAKYDELYTTAPDYMDEKLKILDEDIRKKALAKANAKILKVKSSKEQEYDEKKENMNELILNLAKMIVDENESDIGYDIAEDAKEELDKELREVKKNGQKEQRRWGNVK